MSSALSSVRTRRTQQHPPVTAIASGKAQMPQQPQPQQQLNQPSVTQNPQNIPTHLTLPQILEIFGKRLNALESTKSSQQVSRGHEEKLYSEWKKANDEANKEWNERFEIIAQELADLKDMVLRLQDYTLSVNKTLYENSKNATQNMSSIPVDTTDLDEQEMNTFEYTPNEFYRDDVENESEDV